jgi:hypothetical protein
MFLMLFDVLLEIKCSDMNEGQEEKSGKSAMRNRSKWALTCLSPAQL